MPITLTHLLYELFSEDFAQSQTVHLKTNKKNHTLLTVKWLPFYFNFRWFCVRLKYRCPANRAKQLAPLADEGSLHLYSLSCCGITLFSVLFQTSENDSYEVSKTSFVLRHSATLNKLVLH